MFSNIFVFFFCRNAKKKLEYIWYEKNTKTKYIFFCAMLKTFKNFYFFLVILAVRFKKKEFFLIVFFSSHDHEIKKGKK